MFAFPLNRTPQYQLLICFALIGLFVADTSTLSASAQQLDSTKVDTTIRPETNVTVAPAERKSPIRAVLYSAGGTVLLTPVGGLGLVVGPSFGHFYAGNSQGAWTGIAIRSGGFGTIGVGSLLALGGKSIGWTLMALSTLVIGGSAIYDVVTAWHSTKDYNESYDVSAQVAPTVGPQGEQIGLSLRASF